MEKNIQNENDIAVTTRVRLARNIKGIPYCSRMTIRQAEEVINKVWVTLGNSALKDNLLLYEMNKTDDLTKESLIERHLISPELATSKIPSAAIISRDEAISIMINEEDHIRLQTFCDGLSPDTAYKNAKNIENLLGEAIAFDHDPEFGYLTSCPTNAGSGLRISLMMHLPAISITKNVDHLLKWATSIGMTVRGLYGEGSKASGGLYQLSNQISLGVSDDEIISRFTAAACNLISEERRICAELFEQDFTDMADRCLRSLGILKNAYIISSNEAINLVSNVCMGANSGIINNIDIYKLRKTLFESMPATLSLKQGITQSKERDVKRAQLFQKTLLVKEE